jgi:hypothetical protein
LFREQELIAERDLHCYFVLELIHKLLSEIVSCLHRYCTYISCVRVYIDMNYKIPSILEICFKYFCINHNNKLGQFDTVILKNPWVIGHFSALRQRRSCLRWIHERTPVLRTLKAGFECRSPESH